MDSQRVLDLLLMQAAEGCAWKPRRKPRKRRYVGRALLVLWRVFLVVLAFVALRVRRAYRWFAWKTWEQRKVERGRRRWQHVAGIGKRDGYSMRPEISGHIVR